MKKRSMSLILATFLIGFGMNANADLIFDNGPAGTTTNWCSSNNCDGGSQDWTFLDNFVLAANATVYAFDYVDADFFGDGALNNYINTDWVIRVASAFGADVASGTSVGTIVALGNDQYRITINALDVALTSGVTYWLGTNNNLSSGLTTAVTVAGVSALPGGGAQDDGAGNQLTPRPEHAFRIYSVPEPGTLALLGIGLMGIGMVRSRKVS